MVATPAERIALLEDTKEKLLSQKMGLEVKIAELRERQARALAREMELKRAE